MSYTTTPRHWRGGNRYSLDTNRSVRCMVVLSTKNGKPPNSLVDGACQKPTVPSWLVCGSDWRNSVATLAETHRSVEIRYRSVVSSRCGSCIIIYSMMMISVRLRQIIPVWNSCTTVCQVVAEAGFDRISMARRVLIKALIPVSPGWLSRVTIRPIFGKKSTNGVFCVG